jgi:transcriptional regulator with XRE-family HTH domain
MPEFASRLREQRKLKGLTQKQIAAEFSVSESLWKSYENGSRTPTFDGLIAIADYFNVSIDYLVGRTDNPNPHKD